MADRESSSATLRLSVPEDFFQYIGPADKAGNSLYRCLKCTFGGQQKSISCGDKSRQNLKKHISAMHPSQLTKFEMLCDDLREQNCGKKRTRDQLDGDKLVPAVKQRKLDSFSSLTQLTQHQLDSYVVDYIVDSVLPVHQVDTEAFRRLIHKITQGRLLPACRQTVTKQLEERFIRRKKELKETLCMVSRVCTTADCWTSRRRSFLGTTVHWIDSSTMSRKSACLAVRQIKGKHTYNVLAKAMDEIFDDYELKSKICFTVTDSGSNFIKAFRLFSADDSEPVSVDEPNSEENDDDTSDIEYHEINASLDAPSNGDDDEILYQLPVHWKCACHLLSLVATTDCSKITDPLFKRTSVQTFGKFTALWNKQNRSVAASEKIKDLLGTLLITPGETRWNSVYDAVNKIHSILSVPDLEVKFDKLCDELEIKRLHPIQKTFVKEYVAVMKPVCCGLDILQGDKEIGLGFLLPTLVVMKSQLTLLLSERLSLTVCAPLASCLLNAINNRFSLVLENCEAQLAAVVQPKFKLDWIEDDLQRARITDTLKRRVLQLYNLKVSSASIEEPLQPQAAYAENTKTSSDFFAGLSAKRHHSNDHQDVNYEVSSYLADTSQSVDSLNAYPHIRQLYIELNTGLPSSAAVERLFSLGGRVFSPLRSRMSSEHFEMFTFLRLAKW